MLPVQRSSDSHPRYPSPGGQPSGQEPATPAVSADAGDHISQGQANSARTPSDAGIPAPQSPPSIHQAHRAARRRQGEYAGMNPQQFAANVALNLHAAHFAAFPGLEHEPAAPLAGLELPHAMRDDAQSPPSQASTRTRLTALQSLTPQSEAAGSSRRRRVASPEQPRRRARFDRPESTAGPALFAEAGSPARRLSSASAGERSLEAAGALLGLEQGRPELPPLHPASSRPALAFPEFPQHPNRPQSARTSIGSTPASPGTQRGAKGDGENNAGSAG